MYQNNLQEERVQDVVNVNKIKSDPFGDLTDQNFLQFNGNFETRTAKLKLYNVPIKMIQKTRNKQNFCSFQLHGRP